jgi:polysaccharide pyruvyl transferase WcaK-like protein
MYHGGYTRDNMFGLKFNYKDFLSQLVLKLADETQADILLIPHTFGPPGNVNSDPDACRETMQAVPSSYRNRVHLVAREYNQYEIKGIIGLCDFLIGSRMHACIAGLSQCIPTVGVAYSKKFQGIFDSIDLGNLVIDARVVDIETAVEQVVDHYKNREDIGNRIKERVDIAKKKINETFRDILNRN